MMRNGLIIFDCDGVLVDSETLSAQVLQTMAAELGLPLNADDCLLLLRGRKVATWVAELEVLSGSVLGENFIRDFRCRTATVFCQRLRPIPHIDSVLARISTDFCTASSAPLKKVRHTLRLTGLLPLFEGNIYSAYEVGVWKPDPGLFLHAASDMGAPASECAVVEDSLVGVQAGVAAGMRVFGYAPGDTAPVLAEAGATVFSSMTELLALLWSWKSASVIPLATHERGLRPQHEP